MKNIKIILIHIADAIDHLILGHRFYSVCNKIGASNWWSSEQCHCWYCLKLGTDSGWRSEEK
jgi:hypothetical protein